jgi:hypothetical protein
MAAVSSGTDITPNRSPALTADTESKAPIAASASTPAQIVFFIFENSPEVLMKPGADSRQFRLHRGELR